jgi:hypothetical protein
VVGYRLVLLVLKGLIELHWTLDWSCLPSFDGCRSLTLTSNHQNRLTAAATNDLIGTQSKVIPTYGF